jgi:hypothetical protein
MADVSSLGEYKVVVTADYSQLQNQFKAMSELVSQTAKAMSQSLDGAINTMSSNMVSQLKTMTTSIKDAFGGMDSTIKEAGKSVEGLTKTTQEVGSSVQRSGSSARAGSEGFKAYAAQVRAAEKAEQDFRKMSGKAILAAEERDIAGRTAQHKAFWQEQVKQEQALERQRQAEFAQQQRRISQLQTQYNVAYAEINKYLQTHAKMSEAVFVRLQGKIQAISAEMQRLGAMPTVRNPLAGMNFSDYEKQFGKLDDMMKSLKHHLTWMASAAAIGITFGIPAKTISTIAEVEKQMAAMRQVNHDVNASQEVLNKTTQDFIGIAQQYGHSVDDIIKAGKLQIAA